MHLLMEASSLKEQRLIKASELPLGLQECFQDLLHKQGSLAQGPNAVSPTNTGLKEEGHRVDVKKFVSHSSAEQGNVIYSQSWWDGALPVDSFYRMQKRINLLTSEN